MSSEYSDWGLPNVAWGKFEFKVRYATDAELDFDEASGVYIVAAETDGGRWRALYIGQTDHFGQRFHYHERKRDFRAAGATHIHTIDVYTEAERLRLERLLICVFDPPLNSQHRFPRGSNADPVLGVTL